MVLVVACGIFSCDMRDLVPCVGIEPGPPALGAWSLSHWTTREVPSSNVFACFSSITLILLLLVGLGAH